MLAVDLAFSRRACSRVDASGPRTIILSSRSCQLIASSDHFMRCSPGLLERSAMNSSDRTLAAIWDEDVRARRDDGHPWSMFRLRSRAALGVLFSCWRIDGGRIFCSSSFVSSSANRLQRLALPVSAGQCSHGEPHNRMGRRPTSRASSMLGKEGGARPTSQLTHEDVHNGPGSVTYDR